MFSKFNLKQLLGIFVVLLLIVLGVEVFNGKDRKNSSFKSELINVEPDEIGSFIVYNKNEPAVPVTFTKNGEHWSISKEDKQYNASPQAIDAIKGLISKVSAERIVANNKNKWDEYQVSDSAATRLIVKNNEGKEIGDLYIGKFNYTQPKTQNQNPYQRQQGTMTSFVRMNNDKEVYAVNGYLSMAFDRDIKYMRDPVIMNGNYRNWSKVNVSLPGDSSFVLEKSNDTWMMNGEPADSASVVEYLENIQNLSSTSFYDEAVVSQPQRSITIEGSDLDKTVQIDAYEIGSKHIIASTENKNTYFESGSDNAFKKLFQSRPEQLN